MKTQPKALRIGLIAILIIAFHVIVALYFLIVPTKLQPQNRIASLYRQLVLLGPFFTESRINHSHHLSIRVKRDGTWSHAREVTKERFSSYLNQPWQVQHLAYILYEKQLANEMAGIAKASSLESLQRSSAFREFNAFVMHDVINAPADSVNFIYGLDSYNACANAFVLDTIFNYTYNPMSIGEAKK